MTATGQASAGAARGEVLFLLRSPAYVRNFEPVLDLLGDRGDRVAVLFEQSKRGGDGDAGLALIGELCARHPSLRCEPAPAAARGPRARLRVALRTVRDYLRYFEPPFGAAERLRARVLAPLSPRYERLPGAALKRLPRLRSCVDRLAERIEVSLGGDPRLAAELRRRRPAVLVLTPLVQLRSRQPDWVRAARSLGIPTVLAVHSWDNLTTKGLTHAAPDHSIVWNAAQARELIELHGIAPATIAVAGAWPYGGWLAREPTRSRAALIAELGLAPEQALILYVCSSPFIAPDEPEAVAEWLLALRSSSLDPLVDAGVVVRPHPVADGRWEQVARLPGLTIFPPDGADPVDEASRADYFDCLRHADAIVGVNTSALVEAAIADRPVLAYPPPRYSSSQRDLPHFALLTAEPAAVEVASSVDDHLRQLASALEDPGRGAAERLGFRERFVLAAGAGPAAAAVVAAIDRAALAASASD